MAISDDDLTNNNPNPDNIPDDQEPPFEPARDPELKPNFDDTHPSTDTDMDKSELYDEGVVNAASGAIRPDDDQDYESSIENDSSDEDLESRII